VGQQVGALVRLLGVERVDHPERRGEPHEGASHLPGVLDMGTPSPFAPVDIGEQQLPQGRTAVPFRTGDDVVRQRRRGPGQPDDDHRVHYRLVRDLGKLMDQAVYPEPVLQADAEVGDDALPAHRAQAGARGEGAQEKTEIVDELRNRRRIRPRPPLRLDHERVESAVGCADPGGRGAQQDVQSAGGERGASHGDSSGETRRAGRSERFVHSSSARVHGRGIPAGTTDTCAGRRGGARRPRQR
jgi:hypothetical protein